MNRNIFKRYKSLLLLCTKISSLGKVKGNNQQAQNMDTCTQIYGFLFLVEPIVI